MDKFHSFLSGRIAQNFINLNPTHVPAVNSEPSPKRIHATPLFFKKATQLQKCAPTNILACHTSGLEKSQCRLSAMSQGSPQQPRIEKMEDQKLPAKIDTFCVKIRTSRQTHLLSDHDTGDNLNDALCTFSLSENCAYRHFVADCNSFQNERFLTLEEREGSISDFIENLEPGKMLYACRPTPVRVTIRFLYGKDFDFVDGETCLLPLEKIFALVKGQDKMSTEDIICCINTGEGFYRLVALETSVAAAMKIHDEVARHFDDGQATHNDTILELEHFTRNDLVENLSEVAKVHLPILSLKGEKHYLFASADWTYNDTLEVCNSALKELHLSSFMICRDKIPIVTSNEMCNLNAGQIRQKMTDSDWICQERPFGHFNVIINHEDEQQVIAVKRDSVRTRTFASLASASMKGFLTQNMVCYTENADGTFVQILGSTAIDSIWNPQCDNLVVNMISLQELHGKGLRDASMIAVRLSLPDTIPMLIIDFPPTTTMKDIQKKFQGIYCTKNGVSVHIIDGNNNIFVSEAENQNTTVASLMNTMKPGVSLCVEPKLKDARKKKERIKANVVSP